jgi:nucleoside-diphosphate-sugar epimerase
MSVLREDQLVIFPNTNSGYGKAKDTVCTEETPLNPISLYGQLKDEAEYVVRKHPNHVVFRLATVFGYSPRHRLDLLVNTLVYEAVTKGIVEIFDDSFMRNYIHIDDICSAFEYAITNPELRNNVYNLGNDSLNMSKGDLLEVIAKYIMFEAKKINKTDPDQRDYVVSSEKLYKTGWKPQKSLKDGIIELIRFYSVLPDNPSLLGYMKNV